MSDEESRERASRAFEAGMSGDWVAAHEAVSPIYACRDCGRGMIIEWCDAFIQRMGYQHAVPGELAWMAPGSDGNLPIAEVSPRAQWAGRVIMARAVMDKDTFDALMTALPDEPDAAGSWIGTVLESVVSALQLSGK